MSNRVIVLLCVLVPFSLVGVVQCANSLSNALDERIKQEVGRATFHRPPPVIQPIPTTRQVCRWLNDELGRFVHPQHGTRDLSENGKAYVASLVTLKRNLDEVADGHNP